jgi:hypothetical protein
MTTHKDEELKKAGITPIRHIFQYGPPRTASTTQFNIICVALFLHTRLHRPELAENTICTMSGTYSKVEKAYKFMLQQLDIPQAVKSHIEPDPLLINNSTFVFATARDKKQADNIRERFKKKGLRIGAVQDFEMMKSLGIDFWIKMYAKFFSLPPKDVKFMSAYFNIWEQLRQCCGMQMSKNYRNELVPIDERDVTMKRHQFCSSIDIDALENSFMDTELYQLINEYESMRRINRPATVDGDLDGTYCSRYNAAVRAHGIPESRKQYSGLNSRYDEVEDHWNEELINPFVGIEHLIEGKCGGEEYLFYTSCNGFANQLKGLEVAIRIAYSTNRTLIMPPLLPHKTAKSNSAFYGRDLFTISLDPIVFEKSFKISLSDVAKVRSLESRSEFPSWSEVLNLNDMSTKTGVKVIDLYEFVKSETNACIHEFLRQPSPPVSMLELTTKSKKWRDFIKLFQKQFADYPIALIGNAFILDHHSPDLFISHHKLFKAYDSNRTRMISYGVNSLSLSNKVMELIKNALTYLSPNYVAVHLRTGDSPEEMIQDCEDEVIVNEFNKVMYSLEETNVAPGSTIYIASNDGNAKECFNEITNHVYNVMNVDDVLEADYNNLESNIKEIMDDLTTDPSTNIMLLDALLVSMGVDVYFAMINFRSGSGGHSTFQALIQRLHNERNERLQQLKLLA